MTTYKEAIRLNPDHADAHNNLGLAYLQIGEKNSALEEQKKLSYLDGELAQRMRLFQQGLKQKQ